MILPKSRRRLGRSDKAVAWPRRERGRAPFFSPSRSRMVRGRSVTVELSPSRSRSPSAVPLHDPAEAQRLALAHFGISLPSEEDDTKIYGKTFPKDKVFGIRFRPIRHNWTYSTDVSTINKLLNTVGLGATINTFGGAVAFDKQYPTDVQPTTEVMQQRFVDDWLPALDSGMTKMSVRGSAMFLMELFVVGLQLGFDKRFLVYVVSQIAATEGMSLFIDKNTPAEMAGNSMFGYANHAMLFAFVYKFGGKSGWPLLVFALLALVDFIQQFRMQVANKPIHFLGMFLGLMSYLFLV